MPAGFSIGRTKRARLGATGPQPEGEVISISIAGAEHYRPIDTRPLKLAQDILKGINRQKNVLELARLTLEPEHTDGLVMLESVDDVKALIAVCQAFVDGEGLDARS